MRRLRERWNVTSWSNPQLQAHLVRAVAAAPRRRQFVDTPSGRYIPFSLLGEDGYLVLHENRVVTVLPRELCPEVTEVLGDK